MKKTQPKLQEIDLKKCVSVDNDGAYHGHPDIQVGARHQYLAKIGGYYFAGTFDKQWYGLNFNGWYGTGL